MSLEGYGIRKSLTRELGEGPGRWAALGAFIIGMAVMAVSRVLLG